MKTLLSRVKDLLDEQVEPEKKLMRALLRTEDKEARATIFKNAFRPKSAIALGDVTDAEIEETDTECEVTPPAFIAACKALILNFGNIEADGFAGRLRSAHRRGRGRRDRALRQEPHAQGAAAEGVGRGHRLGLRPRGAREARRDGRRDDAVAQ